MDRGLTARRSSSLAVFLAGAAIIALVRIAILASHGAPATVDSGNWLALGHALFGEHIRSQSLIYPPVVPMTLSLTVALVGPLAGVSLFGAVSSLAPAIVLFFLLRPRIGGWFATFLGLIAAAAGSTGEAAAWGGFPQLLGLGVLLVAAYWVDQWMLTGRRRAALLAGATLLLLAMISDIVFAAGVLCCVAIVLIRLTIGSEPSTHLMATVRTLPFVVLPLVFAVPLYIGLLGAVRHAADGGIALHELPGRVEFLYRELPWLWRPALLLALPTPLLLARRRHDPLWMLATTFVIVPLAAAGTFRQDRFLYLLPLGVLLALALWVQELKDGKFDAVGVKAAAVALAVFAAVQIVTGLGAFTGQRAYYAALDAGLTEAIDWLPHHTPPHSLVAVPSIRSAPVGWWIEGLGHRPTLLASPLRWLTFSDERQRAQIANRVFTVDFPNDATLAIARRAGARYVLVPLRSDIIVPGAVDRYVANHPGILAFRDSTTLILRL